MNEQMNIFDFTRPMFKINNPIRLIELFAGIGTQAMAMETLGADYESHKISEWEVNANFSYKAIHNPDDDTDYSKDIDAKDLPEILYNLGISSDGKEPMTIENIKSHQGGEKWQRSVYNAFKSNNNIGSICNRKGEDLNIVDTDKYTYIMTYSFPCQDLSVAGKGKGMKRGSGTRSGLLWEVERLLKETENLPQVLLMENVPQVHGEGNKEDFQEWIKFLESLGYSNYWEDLNAKNYGIPQSRNRTFMVSILGEYNYKFPSPIELDCVMKDYLEDEVDEKYYITNPKSVELIEELFKNGIIDENGNLCFDNRNAIKNNITDEELDSLEALINSEDGLFAYGLQLGDEDDSKETLDATIKDDIDSDNNNTPRQSNRECIDLTINNPRTNDIANCITARTDAGISNLAKTGNGVIERYGKS